MCTPCIANNEAVKDIFFLPLFYYCTVYIVYATNYGEIKVFIMRSLSPSDSAYYGYLLPQVAGIMFSPVFVRLFVSRIIQKAAG